MCDSVDQIWYLARSVLIKVKSMKMEIGCSCPNVLICQGLLSNARFKHIVSFFHPQN